MIPSLTVRAGAVRRLPVPAPAAVSFDLGHRHVEEVVRSTTLSFRGPLVVRALIISSLADRGALLLHRLAELHSRLPVNQFPLGASRSDHLYLDPRGWTSGFWPGALWEAASLLRGGGSRMFERWALAATLAHFGLERSPTHDVGFMYGESSLLAWRALCQGTRSRPPVCARLRSSVLSAAGELRALAATNRRAGTIPTGPGGPHADTIVDSMMNVLILPWASSVTGDAAYARLALRHARIVARLLVRPDGSTAQAVNFDRRTGRVLNITTHQGLSASSTWSRGQGWAVYGFSELALELRDRSLLRVALRAAGYVSRALPGNGIPLWDYDARPGAPVDVSAGVITAAGMMRLARACGVLRGICPGAPWNALGRRMLAASLTRAYDQRPLGLLADQAYDERAGPHWYNGGELIFGLTYALEAERVAGL